MPDLIERPTIVSAAGNLPKRIEEYVGRVNSATEAASIARTPADASGAVRRNVTVTRRADTMEPFAGKMSAAPGAGGPESPWPPTGITTKMGGRGGSGGGGGRWRTPAIARTTRATIVTAARTIQKTGTFFRTTLTVDFLPAETSKVLSPGFSRASMSPSAVRRRVTRRRYFPGGRSVRVHAGAIERPTASSPEPVTRASSDRTGNAATRAASRSPAFSNTETVSAPVSGAAAPGGESSAARETPIDTQPSSVSGARARRRIRATGRRNGLRMWTYSHKACHWKRPPQESRVP